MRIWRSIVIFSPSEMAVEDVEGQERPVSEAGMWGAAAKVIGIAVNPQMTQSPSCLC